MSLFRPDIENLEPNGIARIAMPRLADPDIIPLWFGEGDLVTAPFIREAAKRALDDGLTFYSHTRGRPELRTAIKTYLDRIYAINLNPDRVSVVGSTMLAITMAAQMGCSSGDHALIVSPSWPNIENTLRVTGADVGFVPQRQSNLGWRLDLEELFGAVRPNTRVIFTNSPCNPTGWVMTPDEQARLLEFCRESNILLIADEVYHRNVFEGDVAPSFVTLANDDDPLIVTNGFSKAWAMTGWRLGWMVAPARYTAQIAALSECFNTGSTVFTQHAGIAALEQGEPVVHELRNLYARGRDLVMDILGNHERIELIEPQGAFYAFPRLPGLTSSVAFAEGLADTEKVGVAPGYTFGPGNEEYFRLCFARSPERLGEALERIARYAIDFS